MSLIGRDRGIGELPRFLHARSLRSNVFDQVLVFDQDENRTVKRVRHVKQKGFS